MYIAHRSTIELKKQACGFAKHIMSKDMNIKTGKVVEMVERKVVNDPDDAVGVEKRIGMFGVFEEHFRLPL